MRYYAKYTFRKCEHYPTSYLLVSNDGKAQNLNLAKYTDSERNKEWGIDGKQYIHFGVPRNPSMTKYFAHTFEGFRGKPITSTEALNDQNRTFGDCFCLGYKDLIFFEFSKDMNELNMWFLKDMGNSKAEKKANFFKWCQGETLCKN